MDSVSSGVYDSKDVKDHDRVPPSSTSLDVKKESSSLSENEPSRAQMAISEVFDSSWLLDVKQDSSSLLDRKNEPSRAQMAISEVFDSSWLLDGESDEVLSRKYIDEELEKMRGMTPGEAAAFAAEAVKEAEIAVAEAEQAEREAREAEEVAREAEEIAKRLTANQKLRRENVPGLTNERNFV